MRVLVLGATGMLGHKMLQTLGQRFTDVYALARVEVKDRKPYSLVDFLQGDKVLSGVDVTDFQRLTGVLASIKPEYIVNCVGIIKQRAAAQQHIPSIMVNSLLPHRLAALSREWGGRVIHFSTDCVFSGRRGSYNEDDESDAIDLYGRTKALGEVQDENALTLRTSIIGRELANRTSLLEWFLSQDGGTVKGFTRVIYSGVTTNQLANVVSMILREHPTLSGLYQVVADPISKHDLLALVRDTYGLNIQIIPDDSEVSDRSMSGDRLRGATGYVSPSWPTLISDLYRDPTPYHLWR